MTYVQYLASILDYNSSALSALQHLASSSCLSRRYRDHLPRPRVTRNCETAILQSLKCGLHCTSRYPNPVSPAQVQVHVRMRLLLTCSISRHSLTALHAHSLLHCHIAIRHPHVSCTERYVIGKPHHTCVCTHQASTKNSARIAALRSPSPRDRCRSRTGRFD